MAAVVALATTCVACDRPHPLLICHNANCVSPDASLDDTIPTLRASLALRFDGRPALDGIELDTVWDGAEGRCIFAHDLGEDTATPAADAAEEVATYLRATTPGSWNGERFYLLVELKDRVGHGFSDFHTPAQRTAHAECGLDVLDTVRAAAQDSGQALTVAFIGPPDMLAEVRTRPRWPGRGDGDLDAMLVADVFVPIRGQLPTFADYDVPLDAVEYHPDFITDPRAETYRSLGLDLVQWSFTTTPEALQAIEHFRPSWVISNEGGLLRRWLER